MRADVAGDILIAGAGPAGVALALRLRRLGYDVRLATPSMPPSRSAHDLETLSPAVEKLMSHLELSPALERARLDRLESEISWSGESFEPRPSSVPSLLIDRRAFHASLRELAADSGVKIWDGRIASLQPTDCGWRVRGNSGLGALDATVAMVADASGRRGLFRTARRRGPPLAAIHAIWSGQNLPDALRVAAGPQGWVWGVPLRAGRYLTTVFQDPRHTRRAAATLTERVRRAVFESAIVEEASRLAFESVQGVSDATPHVGSSFDGRSLFRVGDAALALDPLSSSGVQAALQSAIDTALAIHTLRLDPGASELTDAFLSRRLERRRARHAAWTGALYQEGARRFPHLFWLERSASAANAEAKVRSTAPAPLPAPEQPVALDRDVRMEPEACAVGDCIAWRPAIVHPMLMEPVAFLNGIEVSGLFSLIVPGAPAVCVVQDWSARIGQDAAIRIFSWAWQTGLICSSG